jgi:hypothetical protein
MLDAKTPRSPATAEFREYNGPAVRLPPSGPGSAQGRCRQIPPSAGSVDPQNDHYLKQWTARDAFNQYLRRGSTHPFALVVWWTHRTVAVACPYCHMFIDMVCNPQSAMI